MDSNQPAGSEYAALYCNTYIFFYCRAAARALRPKTSCAPVSTLARHYALGRSDRGAKKIWPAKAPGVDCAAACKPLALVLHVAKLVKDKAESGRAGRSSSSCGR